MNDANIPEHSAFPVSYLSYVWFMAQISQQWDPESIFLSQLTTVHWKKMAWLWHSMEMIICEY